MKKYILQLTLLFMLCTYQVSAQWQMTNTDSHTNIDYLVMVNHDTGYATPHYRTTDGGKTWSPFSKWDQYDSGIFKYKVYKLANGNLLLLSYYFTVISKDNGLTWDTAQIGRFYSFRIDGNYFYDDNIGIMWNASLGITKTTDGGIHWQEFYKFDRGIFQFFQFEPQTYISTDYSAKTMNVLKDTGRQIINTFDLPASPIYITVTPDKRLYGAFTLFNPNIRKDIFFNAESRDTGRTWQQLDSNDVKIDKIFFTTADTGYMIGNNGYVSKSVDSGRHWFKQPTPTKLNLMNYCVVDHNTILIGTDSGSILYTDNGGGTTGVKPPIAPILSGLNFYPNPGRGSGVVALKSVSAYRMQLYVVSITGQILIQKAINIAPGENQIPISLQSGTSTGVYRIMLTDGQGNAYSLPMVIMP